MKNKLSIVFILFCALHLCQAQTSLHTDITLYTSKGVAFMARAFYEQYNSQSEIDDATFFYYSKTNYPNAELLEQATWLYNCHSYAWNMSEGGPVCWIYNTEVGLYWTDPNNYPSYIEVFSESEAEKIHYVNGDHSAIKDPNNSGKYISKWGNGPLVKHALRDLPQEYGKAGTIKYYKKNYNLIFGSHVVCEKGNKFFFNNAVSGTVNWSLSAGSPFSFSPTSPLMNVSGNPITVYWTGSGTSGGILSASVQGGGFHSMNIVPCVNPLSIASTTSVYDPICLTTWGRTFVLRDGNGYSCAADWSLSNNNGNFTFSGSSSNRHYVIVKTPQQGGSATLTAKVGNKILAERTVVSCGTPPTPFINANNFEVCCDADTHFWLNYWPSFNIYWTLSDTNIFAFDQNQWEQHNGTVYVIRKGMGSSPVPVFLCAHDGSVNGQVIACAEITACAAGSTKNIFNKTMTYSETHKYDCGHIALQNVTINSPATLTLVAGGNITLQNVTIANGGKLSVQAGGHIIVADKFDIQSGGIYEVK